MAYTFDEWLVIELDKKLASLPTDAERYRHTKAVLRLWSVKFDRFLSFGTQPFAEPHPQFGNMDAFNFRLLICVIEERIARLEFARVPA